MIRISGHTRIAAVLGWPVEHSRSPALHNAGFAALGIDAVFVALPVEPARLADAVRGLAATGALGASVTVPHKEAVLSLCDELASPADRIGAVNCLVFDRGRVIGHNTDAGGFVDGLREAGVTLEGRATLLGAGGAARAVAAGLIDAGLAVEVVARRPQSVTWTVAQPWSQGVLRDQLARSDLLVDCTPLALAPDAEAPIVAALPLEDLPAHAAVASLVYHREPLLLARAHAHGHRTVDGRAMLVHQGARAFTLWTGRQAPLEAMFAAFDAAG
jgi:shikimate dehydrogenase